MKTVTVTYLLSNNYNNPKHFVQRYLIENEDDIQEALKKKLINLLHVEGIRKSLLTDRVILNDEGGYCPMKGTWQIIPDTETVHRAVDAMLKGKSFRMRNHEKEEWKKTGSHCTSTWFVITSIRGDKNIDVVGNNHDVFENIYMDSLIGV
jgi:hypothetical protein